MNQVLRTHEFASGQQLQLVHGDITIEQVDAIVNAANAHLRHGGGVARIIARKAGRRLNQKSRQWVKTHGPVTHGEPAFTTAGNLPCRYVIHAVGPVWGSGDEDRKLAAAVTGSLRRAEELQLQSISLPAISTGIFGFPKKRAATVIFNAIHEHIRQHPRCPLQQVRIVLFDQPTLTEFLNAFDQFPWGDSPNP